MLSTRQAVSCRFCPGFLFSQIDFGTFLVLNARSMKEKILEALEPVNITAGSLQAVVSQDARAVDNNWQAFRQRGASESSSTTNQSNQALTADSSMAPPDRMSLTAGAGSVRLWERGQRSRSGNSLFAC